jgi:murein DD-endopeptidase MepM/ murein hydrolase activator NlpD
MVEKSRSNGKRGATIAAMLLPLGLLAACAGYDDREPQLDWPLHHGDRVSRGDYHPGSTYYTVRVRPGDTLSELADRYDVRTADVARINGISDHDSIYAGDMLRIPAGSRATRSAVYADAMDTPSRGNPYTPAPEPRRGGYPDSSRVSSSNLPPVSTSSKPTVVASNTPKPGKTPAWYTPSAPAVTPTAPSSSSGQVVQQQQPVIGSSRFVWPVSGRVISDFGSTSSGERNDGINIAANPGDPIRAAASGTVTYAGNQLRSYGNLLLIKHDDGYVTAYAHAQSIVVQKGARVLKGQVVAYVGQTGDVTAPQLHFEIRNGVTPVNPKPLLVASR